MTFCSLLLLSLPKYCYSHYHANPLWQPDVSVIPGDTNVPGAYLSYNEYICYDVTQVRLRYLFRVKM